MIARWVTVPLLLLAVPVAWADPPPALSSAWARASTPHASAAAVYLTITDPGGPDRLIAASTPVAAAASVHESRMVGSVMQMRPVAALPVASGQTVVLAPGGYHVMLTGLRAPLLAGQHFPITLTFEKAGPVTATVTVRTLRAGGPPAHTKAMDMPGMNMKGMDMPGMDMKGMNMGNGG
jgi:copper(I)-binding protein